MIHHSLIINILIAYGALQALFIAIVLIATKDKSLFKKAFAFLLIIEAITLFERLLVETELINSVPHLLGISHPISFLKPLLIFLMALTITHKGFRLQRKMYWHLAPFMLMLLLNIPFYCMSGPDKLKWVKIFMEQVPSYASFGFYFSLSFFAYIGVYIFLSIKKLSWFRKQVINNDLVNWYRKTLIIYSVFLILHLLYFLIQPIGKYSFELVNQISMLAMTFIIQSIAFKLVDKSPILNITTPDLSNLQKRKEHEQLIIDQFEKNKVHIEDDLSLQSFSESISLPPSYVSKIINQNFNYSFKKLVAQYRVNEAKYLMGKSDHSKVKLIDIAYESGFNNKVSFYRAFKEFEHTSPSEYLEKIKK